MISFPLFLPSFIPPCVRNTPPVSQRLPPSSFVRATRGACCSLQLLLAVRPSVRPSASLSLCRSLLPSLNSVGYRNSSNPEEEEEEEEAINLAASEVVSCDLCCQCCIRKVAANPRIWLFHVRGSESAVCDFPLASQFKQVRDNREFGHCCCHICRQTSRSCKTSPN